jgi:hypothetical protein
LENYNNQVISKINYIKLQIYRDIYVYLFIYLYLYRYIEIANTKEETKQEKQRMKDDLKGVQNKCASHAEISSGLHEEERKLKEGKEANQLIKDHMLDAAEKVTAYFAE